jgi:hypothetical protein
MRKLTMTLTAALFVLGTTAIAANAQTQGLGAGSFHAQIQNATPLKEAACRGFGPACGPGFTRVCNRWRCWCRPCY